MSDVVRTVGRFEIIREVGRGGMAMVWLARQTDLDRMVALKELAPFHAADPAFAARFLRESRIAGSLNHPNIVTVHDYLESEGVPYISMEYMEHGSLRPLIGSLSLAQVAYVLEGMFAALAYAEQQGIVHRDLKPENVMVRADGQVKITDFGIAKAYNQVYSGGFHTATGTTVGTPAYMAPEQAMAKALGPFTDLYSTGVMAYELLVGQVPFSDTETPVAILMRHVNDPPPLPRTIRPDLDEDIEAWLLKLLEKDPASRFQHATDAWDAFEEIVVATAGPRWRRDARVLGLGGGTYSPTPPRLSSIPRIVTPEPTNTPEQPRHEPPVAAPAAHDDPPRPIIESSANAEANATAPARLVPQAESFEWPAHETGTTAKPAHRSRRPLAIAAGLIALVGAGIAVAIALSSGGASDRASSSVTSPRVASTPGQHTKAVSRPSADPPLTARERLAVVSGNIPAIADQRGHLLTLDPSTLATRKVANDPRGLGAFALFRGSLVALDGADAIRYRPVSLTPISARGLSGHPVGLAASGSTLIAAVLRRGHGELCTAGGLGPVRCTRTPAVPVGISSGRNGSVLVAEKGSNQIVPYSIVGGRFVAARPIMLPSPPVGPITVAGRSAYVAVRRGILVANLETGFQRAISLPTTTSSLLASGRSVLAALPNSGAVAVIQTSNARRTIVKVGLARPVALFGYGNSVAVVDAKAGRVVSFDPVHGTRQPPRSIATLRGPRKRALVVTTPRVQDSEERTVVVTVPIAHGRIAGASLVRNDVRIADGAATITAWAPGAIVRAHTTRLRDIAVQLASSPGGLRLHVRTGRNVFVKLEVSASSQGLRLTMTRHPPAPPTVHSTPSTPQPSYTTPTAAPTTPVASKPTPTIPAAPTPTAPTHTTGGGCSPFCPQ